MLEQVRGFELLVGPYTVAHQRLAVRSAELAGELLPPDDVAVFLTDTLAPSHAEETKARVPLALKPLTQEREAADRIKDRTPIIAILGNPPYDRSKAASGQWIEESLMRDFKDPVPREDRVHLKSLADPYVYFFRWSLWKLFEQERESGPRLLSFISNSSYLGGEAFQGMRKVLRERFDGDLDPRSWRRAARCQPERERLRHQGRRLRRRVLLRERAERRASDGALRAV